MTWLLYEKELGKAELRAALDLRRAALEHPVRGTPEQIERYLKPCLKGETWDCLAMTEPGAGSDLRGMKASAKADGDDFILNGTKHFISHADVAISLSASWRAAKKRPRAERRS